MKTLFLYVKAHCFNSATAAVDLIKNNPSQHHLKLAEKLLKVKMAPADIFPARASGDNRAESFASEKHHILAEFIHSIKSIGNQDDRKYPIGKIAFQDGKLARLPKPSRNNFNHKFLPCYDLSEKDLRKCNFSYANTPRREFGMEHNDLTILSETIQNFSGSNLDQVNFRKVTVLSRANFRDASMVGAKLSIDATLPFSFDFTGANLKHASILLKLPTPWTAADLEALFGFAEDSDTLLDVIGSISDEYAGVKINLFHQIFQSLDNAGFDLKAEPFVNEMFLNTLAANDIYLKDEKILAFARQCVNNIIEKADNEVFLHSFNQQELLLIINTVAAMDSSLMLEHNTFFIQLISCCAYHHHPELRQQARTLYQRYLNLNEIKPYTSELAFNHGSKQADWREKDNYNYILFNNNKALITSHENITTMLYAQAGSSDVSWNQFYLYHGDRCQPMANIDCNKLFSEDFKIFNASYQAASDRPLLFKFILQFRLCEFESRFKSVVSGVPVSKFQKIIRHKDQLRLAEFFQDAFALQDRQAERAELHPDHYQHILTIFDLTRASESNIAQLLFSLAVLFIRLSSAQAFGTEKDSPQVLRDYAWVLLKKANELDPQLAAEQFTDWRNRLLGLPDAHPCTGLLFSEMKLHADQYFSEIFASICPLKWQ